MTLPPSYSSLTIFYATPTVFRAALLCAIRDLSLFDVYKTYNRRWAYHRYRTL